MEWIDYAGLLLRTDLRDRNERPFQRESKVCNPSRAAAARTAAGATARTAAGATSRTAAGAAAGAAARTAAGATAAVARR
jgi:hypothetical protein